MATDFSLATDYWNATLQNIVEEKPALATFAYENYELFNKFFQNALKVKGGDSLEGHITLDSEGNARLVGIWEQDNLEKKNINKKYTAYWRQATGGMMWNLMETSVNAGKQKIYDVLETQYESAVKDIIEAIYLSMVTGPTSATDDDSPNSLNTWLRIGTASSTGGWTGYQSRYNDSTTTPGTAYDTAGLTSSSTVNTGWASYYADHLGNIDESCLSMLDEAVRRLNFRAPTVPKTIGAGNGLLKFSMYTSNNVFKKLNTFYSKSDDNMGYEKNRDSHWGTPTFLGIPFAYCDLLNTARPGLYGTDPIFGLNHNEIFPIIHQDWNFKELDGQDPNRMHVLRKKIWVRYQMWCRNPKYAGFLISQHGDSD